MSEVLNSDFPMLLAFQDQITLARQSLPDTYSRWVEIDRVLAKLRNDPAGHSYFHLDSSVDLVLRLAEHEQLQVFKKHDAFLMGGASFMQIALSKMWLFSAYELMRTTCEHSICSGKKSGSDDCKKPNCLRCQVLSLKQKLNSYRVHLAKLETEARSKKGEIAEKSHVGLVFGTKNGSVGWTTKDLKSGSDKTTTRLSLSNRILDSLAPTVEVRPT